MKKTLILMLSVISIFILVGCNKKITTDGEKVTSEDLVKSIKKVHNIENITFSTYLEQLSIEINYKDTNAKNISKEFKENVKKIINDNKNLILDYKEIKKIEFIPLMDKDRLFCSDVYKVENNKISMYLDDVNEESIQHGLDILNGKCDSSSDDLEESKTPIENNNTNTNTNDGSASVPESGEFKPETLINDLNIGNSGLDHSTFEVKDSGDKKVISVDLLYKKDALVKGIVTKIQFLLERAFKDSGYDIDLCISQKHPMDLYRCKYVDGSWSE